MSSELLVKYNNLNLVSRSTAPNGKELDLSHPFLPGWIKRFYAIETDEKLVITLLHADRAYRGDFVLPNRKRDAPYPVTTYGLDYTIMELKSDGERRSYTYKHTKEPMTIKVKYKP